MKKIVAIAAAAAMTSGMLQPVYADTGFDIVSAGCNDSGEIVITFNQTPAENEETVYFLDGDGNKIYASLTAEETSLKIAFPDELLGKKTKLVVSGDTQSQDSMKIEQAYVYPVDADSKQESFNTDCDWVYLDTNCLSQNTETINKSFTVTANGQLDKDAVGGKMNHIIIPSLNYKSFNSKSYTVEYKAKAVNDASTAAAFVNLGGIKRISRAQFSVLGYGVSINKGDLVLKRFENADATSDTIQKGLEAEYRTALLNSGYTNGYYKIKIEVNSTDDEVRVNTYTAPIDENGKIDTYSGPFTYTDNVPVSTGGSFGFSGWTVNDNGWEIDDVNYETGIKLGDAVTSGNLIEQANEIIGEVLSLKTAEGLAEKTEKLNDVITELGIFGMDENDIPEYQNYLDKCNQLQRFDVADISASNKDAQYTIISFTSPVDTSMIDECIYAALDDRTALDAKIYANDDNANEVIVKLPVDFADRYVNLVVSPDFKSAEGIKIYSGHCIRLELAKVYSKCETEEEFTKDFAPYSTTGSKSEYKDVGEQSKDYRFTEDGLNTVGTWFARDKEFAAENSIIEFSYKSHGDTGEGKCEGIHIASRLSGIYTDSWKWYGYGYSFAWYNSNLWINKLTPFKQTIDASGNIKDEIVPISNGGYYANKHRLITNQKKMEQDQWYNVRFVTTTLASGAVKLDLYITEQGTDFSDTPSITYTDSDNPNTNPGTVMFGNIGEKNANYYGYFVYTSTTTVVANYTIEDVSKIADEMSERLNASTVDSSDREEVQYLSNTMAFLEKMNVDITKLEGYANYTELCKIFPSVQGCKVTDNTSCYYFDFEISHPVKAEFVDKSSFVVLKDSSATENYDVSLLNENTLRVTLYNDRNYSGKYKVTASKNIENTLGLNIGADFVCEYTEKAPLSVSEPIVDETGGKLNVTFDITGDDAEQAKNYIIFTLLLQKEKKADGKVYTKTIDKNVVSGTLTSAGEKKSISSEFDKPEGEYEIYTTVFNDLNGIKQIYKSQKVKSN